ncbi:hypothetical protein R1sor_007782 [Riccia sorocarpa]|uniref:GDSL esterase/lipase n=1 Tax=Riccia sorocarpa TaxID=122646 RepID=A0ABD3HTL8_9MARC
MGLGFNMKLLFLSILASLLLSGAKCETTNFDGQESLLEESTHRLQVPALFVFGDSLLDAGTNNYFPSFLKADHEPYGKTHFHKPTGRWTNGRTVADFFAEKLGLNFPEPYLKPRSKGNILQGVNYASGGSGVFRTTGENQKVIPFPDQIFQFNQTRISIAETLKSAEAAEHLISKSLFLISIGANDLMGYIRSPQPPPFDLFLQNLTSTLEDKVSHLYRAGGRKFMLFGLAPLGCVPAILVATNSRDGKCYEPANKLATVFNTVLEQLVLLRFPKVFPEIKAIVGKSYETVEELVANGKAHGFTGGLNACCGYGLYNAEVQCGFSPDVIKNPTYNLCQDPGTHVFWDFYHPTERVYSIVAKKYWNGDVNVVAPMNLKTLILEFRNSPADLRVILCPKWISRAFTSTKCRLPSRFPISEFPS